MLVVAYNIHSATKDKIPIKCYKTDSQTDRVPLSASRQSVTTVYEQLWTLQHKAFSNSNTASRNGISIFNNRPSLAWTVSPVSQTGARWRHNKQAQRCRGGGAVDWTPWTMIYDRQYWSRFNWRPVIKRRRRPNVSAMHSIWHDSASGSVSNCDWKWNLQCRLSDEIYYSYTTDCGLLPIKSDIRTRRV